MSKLLITGPAESMARLRDGNARFAANKALHPSASPSDRMAVLEGQKPFATIISCSDSRVPPEILFDCGIGELFVIRTAGNILDNLGLGSLFYAVLHLNCPLIVVLGHESCGAVTAALGTDDVVNSEPPQIREMLHAVRSQIPDALAAQKRGESEISAAIEENTRTTVDALRKMTLLKERINSGVLEIVTGYYSLSKGTVTFGYTRT